MSQSLLAKLVYVRLSRTTHLCRQNKTCCEHTSTSFFVVTRLARHNVVAPLLAAPLLTDVRRSTVGSGTREDSWQTPM